jgi:hypothetical protein
VNPIGAGREEVVLKRSRTVIGVDDVAGLLVDRADPFGELHRVRDGSGEEDVANFVREEDNGFFPNDTTLCEEVKRERRG